MGEAIPEGGASAARDGTSGADSSAPIMDARGVGSELSNDDMQEE